MTSETTPAPPLRDGWRHVPLPRRLPPESAVYEQVIERHDEALQRGFPTYADPASGFSVFTSDFLASRDYCCESGCRHCPYAV